MSHDLAIARASTLRPITEVAAAAGIPADALELFGKHIAKLESEFLRSLNDRADGKLVLVTAINPTPAGEGKTTTTIGLGDAINRIGKKAVIALREPSLGPVFGAKGGATGGGRSQVMPMERINLHFTGDFHAITSAHNLLAALIDNHLYWGNALAIDARRIVWRRVLDMNDRALRAVSVGLGGAAGPGANGFARESGFDITVASEVMACFCLAGDLADLETRLARIVVAHTREWKPVTAGELRAAGAMTALLKDAFRPNLVQTIDGTPALIHGGPFANIAHGCNSLVATRAALKLGDYCITEAGFGADLGAEKFFDIKCRQAGLMPACAVLVATVRALKYNGGIRVADLQTENLTALQRGLGNLGRHVRNVREFGVPVIVAINHFTSDTEAEHRLLADICEAEFEVEAVQCRHWAEGAAGAEQLARCVVARCDAGEARFTPLYASQLPLDEKIRTIATRMYGAAGVAFTAKAAADLEGFAAAGYGQLPICMAKTQVSFSADPTLLGAPSGHVLPVREVRLAAGAGFIVAICGDIMTMPGLPKVPAAHGIHVNPDGAIDGLF
ncbi:MAG: formate--tetrahydrofolate ligase [Pseudomonadota bacterium]|nr:formate--tetrahydrofolate ligase [Pseudomonadota bacterium]